MKNRLVSVCTLAVLAAILTLVGCPEPMAPLVEIPEYPVISPGSGEFSSSVLVYMESMDPDALVRYTIDGEDPTESASTYTMPFRVLSSRTVKAIALKDDVSSGVVSSSIIINTDPDAGTITGKILLPSYALDIPYESISIFSDSMPEYIGHPDPDGRFFIENLDVTKAYDLFFTNEVTGNIRAVDVRSRGLVIKNIPPGIIIANQVTDVNPGRGPGKDLGEVLLKKPGFIAGQIQKGGETDHTGIDVYIPGTSYFAKTDAAGDFTISNVPEGIYLLRGEKTDYTFVELVDVEVLSEQTTNVPGPLFIYEGFGVITGAAVLPGEADSSGIVVLATNIQDSTLTYNTVTDTGGAYSLHSVVPGYYNMLLSKSGYRNEQSDDIQVEAGTNTTVPTVYVQIIGGSLSGRASITGASDHSGISVLAENASTGNTYSMTTNTDGNFTFGNIAPGAYSLTASQAGYTSQGLTGIVLAAGANLTGHTFPALLGNGTIMGMAFSEGSFTYGGISATARNTSDNTISYSSTTDSQGVFIISDVEPGEYQLIISKDGFITDSSITVQVLPNETNSGTSVTLAAYWGSVAGSFTLESQTDHSGIQILIYNADSSVTYTTATDTSGNFRIAPVTPTTYFLQASRGGFHTVTTSAFTVASGAEQMVAASALGITLGSGSVSGSAVIPGETDNGGITVQLVNQNDTSQSHSAITDSFGAYTIGSVVPGSYTITFAKVGYQNQQLTGISVEGGQTTLVETMQIEVIGGSISGAATVAGATDHSGISILAENLDNGKKYSTSTDIIGNYSFALISPGAYNLSASLFGYSTQHLAGVILGVGGSQANRNFPLLTPARGTISGKAYTAGTTAFDGILVTATNTSDNSIVYTDTTDTQGVFIVSDVEPGIYLLVVSKASFVTDNSTTVQILADEIHSSTVVTLGSALGTITGSATLESQSDHSGIDVLAVSEDNTVSVATVTDASGDFLFASVPPMTYRLQFSKSGYYTDISAPFSFGGGETYATASVTLSISSRSVGGNVTLQGTGDYSGVRVNATNIADNTVIYSTLTNSAGYYALAGMVPGEFLISYSKDGYRGHTAPSIDLLDTSSLTMDLVDLSLATGQITGIATLEGRADSTGIAVTLVGTAYATTTNSAGIFVFTVPAGSYPGGVRFEKEDFAVTAVTPAINVLTDSAYAVPSTELSATHVAVIGNIDLVGMADNSGIAVSLDGQPGITTTSNFDGNYVLSHVPIGTYTIRFTRANTPDVTSTLGVSAADVIEVPDLTMIPNAASVSGWAKLDGESDSSSITATVSGTGEPDLTTLTAADGSFYFGNVPSNSSPTLSFSRNGWDTESLALTGLAPLEERIVGLSPEIILYDTTAPAFAAAGVEINAGANMTDSADVQITLATVETGSGIDRMQVSDDGVFDVEPWEPFAPSFSRSLPSTGNGTRQVWVRLRDLSGNVSPADSDTIELTDQYKTYSGVLTSSDLHWQKADGIIMVTGHLLVPVGETLTIDPGVEVRFDGAYYLKVDGEIVAIGTEAEPIIFTRSPAFSGYWDYWDSISVTSDNVQTQNRYEWLAGNVFKHCLFSYAENAIKSSPTGSFVIESCFFDDTNKYSIYVYTSQSGASDHPVVIHRSEIMSPLYYVDFTQGGGLFLVNNYLHGITKKTVDNGIVRLGSRYNTFHVLNNTFSDSVGNIVVYNSYGNMHTIVFSSNIVTEITGNLALYDHAGRVETALTFNNIYDIWGADEIDVVNSYAFDPASANALNATGNYWGADHTLELNSIGDAGNASFIQDYYDDFMIQRTDYADWLQDPLVEAGFRGDQFVDYDFTIDSTDTTERNHSTVYEPFAYAPTVASIDLAFTVFTPNALSEIKIAQSVSDLFSAPWQAYSATTTIVIDVSKVEDGLSTIYTQSKDSLGNASRVVSHKLAWDNP
jgi:hypothetical protein